MVPLGKPIRSPPAAAPVVTPTQTTAAPSPATVAEQPAAPAAEPTLTKVTIEENKLVEVPIGKQPLEITSTDTALQGNQLYLTVTASGDATKLLATYGNQSVMLDPSENNQWYGYIPLGSLNSHTNLTVYAYDINGNLTHAPVSQFSSTLNPTNDGVVEGASISMFGKIINPAVWEEKIILIILAALVACLALTIAVRRHVQHVGLIANTSFVAMLAAFLLMI